VFTSGTCTCRGIQYYYFISIAVRRRRWAITSGLASQSDVLPRQFGCVFIAFLEKYMMTNEFISNVSSSAAVAKIKDADIGAFTVAAFLHATGTYINAKYT